MSTAACELTEMYVLRKHLRETMKREARSENDATKLITTSTSRQQLEKRQNGSGCFSTMLFKKVYPVRAPVSDSCP
nr:hypothetical protein LSAT_9X43300 [Ipomoea trifida]